MGLKSIPRTRWFFSFCPLLCSFSALGWTSGYSSVRMEGTVQWARILTVILTVIYILGGFHTFDSSSAREPYWDGSVSPQGDCWCEFCGSRSKVKRWHLCDSLWIMLMCVTHYLAWLNMLLQLIFTCRSPLMIAAGNGEVCMVKLLLQFDADTTLKDTKGCSADNYAGINGHHS